jgi:hypothetical protein
MRKSERELNQRMLLKVIVFQLNTPLMMKNSRTSLMLLRRHQSWRKLEKLKAGFHPILKQILLNTKENLKLWRVSSILSCKRSTAKAVFLQEVQDSQEELVSQEVPVSQEELDSQVQEALEVTQAQALTKLIDR